MHVLLTSLTACTQLIESVENTSALSQSRALKSSIAYFYAKIFASAYANFNKLKQSYV